MRDTRVRFPGVEEPPERERPNVTDVTGVACTGDKAASVVGMPRAMKKSDLPEKTCPVCGRPFAWRKKWARVWAEVRYCSDRCRRRRGLVEPGKEAEHAAV